jgi:CMP-N-acetylneuraminic acid synthetase
MNYVVLICARGGSKGLPGKNIKYLDGIPLIGWSINVAKQIDKASRVIVSTDSKNIADVALEYGAEVPFMRPKELALDSSPEWDVWKHAICYLKQEKVIFDGLIVLPVTSPLRNVEDVNKCIDEYENGNVDSVITVSEANRNPYFNMVVKDSDNYLSLVIPPIENIATRQEAPTVFDMTTVAYIINPDFVTSNDNIFEGLIRSVFIPPERAVDIDTELDFKLAECIVRDKL